MVRPPVLATRFLSFFFTTKKPRLPCCVLSTRQSFLRQRVYRMDIKKRLMSTGGYHDSISDWPLKSYENIPGRLLLVARLLISLSTSSMLIGSTHPLLATTSPWDREIQGLPMCSWASIKVALFVKIGSEISHLGRAKCRCSAVSVVLTHCHWLEDLQHLEYIYTYIVHNYNYNYMLCICHSVYICNSDFQTTMERSSKDQTSSARTLKL